MYNLTGKRAVLVGFSYGNLPLVEALAIMNTENKEKKVK
jgi:hypothetical protein